MTFEQHPLSAAFPAMADVELEALAEDIKKHGQREPGLLFEGKILDGWHRYLACQKIGMDFWSDGFTGDDPISFVLSKNLHRRHLTASQRAAALVAVSSWRQPDTTTVVAHRAAITVKERLILDPRERASVRAAIWAAAQEPDGDPERALLDFPLQSGRLLRNATADEVRASAEAYYQQADDMRQKAKWLALVADQLHSKGVAYEDDLHYLLVTSWGPK